MKFDLKQIKDSLLKELSSYQGIADLLIFESQLTYDYKISVEIIFYRQSYLNLLDKCENRDSLDWEINNLVRSFLKYMGIGKRQIGSVEILTIEDMDKSSVCMMLSFDDIEPLEKIF